MKPLPPHIPTRLAEYGYSLSPENRIVTPGGKTTQVELTIKGQRIYAGSATTRLWSGPDVGKFLEGFWYAKPLTTKTP